MSKGKILVVDPDEDIRNMLDTYFTAHGYEVLTKTDAKYALLLLRYYQPNVVLLAQPGKKGYYGYTVADPTEDYFPLLRVCKQKNIPLMLLIDGQFQLDANWDGRYFR